MFSHVMLGMNDPEVSKRLYDAILGTLGLAVANTNSILQRVEVDPGFHENDHER